MKKQKLLFIALLSFGTIFGDKTTQSPEEIIDNTENIITIEIKQSTKELVKILDDTIVNGKLRICKSLKGKRLSKKKIVSTTCQLEKIINKAIEDIESKKGKTDLIIREKTNQFIAKTKKRVFNLHKQMMKEMRKSIWKSPEIVKTSADKAKDKIAQFEKKIMVKIAKFSNKIKNEIKKSA